MFGAILGDIIGSPYEFDCNNIKTKDFPLFSQKSHFTDDTVMTLAVAKAFMDTEDIGDEDVVKANLVASMRKLGTMNSCKFCNCSSFMFFLLLVANTSAPVTLFQFSTPRKNDRLR